MTVLFYTATCFMDISLDVINVLKQVVDLHVLIEIHPGVKTFNIVDIGKLPEGKVLVHPSAILPEETYQYYEPYFSGVKSVHFAVHSRKSLVTSLQVSYAILQFVKQIKPEVLHLEALLIRSMSLIPSMLYFKKLVMSIHDPVPHSGEKNVTENMLRSFYFQFPLSKFFLFYSQFAKEQFEQHYKKRTSHKGVIQMKPFTYFSRITHADKTAAKHILFFGRLSKYKGVDVLLDAMPLVIDEFPHEVLVVAGRSISGFELDENIVQKHSRNITLLNRYIANNELIRLITEAKFIVCPYLDATQSGVLMTAFALNTPVIATRVGAFPEYIKEGVTGLLVPPGDHNQLADKIKQALRNDFYDDMRDNIMGINSGRQWSVNKDVFLQAYSR